MTSPGRWAAAQLALLVVWTRNRWRLLEHSISLNCCHSDSNPTPVLRCCYCLRLHRVPTLLLLTLGMRQLLLSGPRYMHSH
jgi:hypothetical protein